MKKVARLTERVATLRRTLPDLDDTATLVPSHQYLHSAEYLANLDELRSVLSARSDASERLRICMETFAQAEEEAAIEALRLRKRADAVWAERFAEDDKGNVVLKSDPTHLVLANPDRDPSSEDL